MLDMEGLRARVNLSREEVGTALDLTEASIRNWEAGRTEPSLTPAKYWKLLILYNCTPEELATACEISATHRTKGKPGRPPKPKQPKRAR